RLQRPVCCTSGPRRRHAASVFGDAGSGMKRPLERLLRQALSDAIDAGDLPALPASALPIIGLDVPSDPRFGDLASNVALVLAKRLGRPPRKVAEAILARITDPGGWLAATEIAGPGFINVRFAPGFWRMILADALAAGEAYGRAETGAGRRVQV